jgi:tRNA modification GTPase
MLNQNNDTITAISTPEGEGAIAIIRISGPLAIELSEKFFTGKTKLSQASPGKLQLGKFYFLTSPDSRSPEIHDQVMAVVFNAPHSYTTEDMVEIHCHGSRFITKKIIETLVNAGARLAEPGEFTFRAFINGRIDLSQAEAVADLIKAGSDLEIKNSLQQLEGYFSDNLKKLRSKLVEIVSLLELELDFAEEEVEFVKRNRMFEIIDEIEVSVQRYLQSFDRAKIMREGARVVLVGKPNVGKSSLLNALLKENRAIVTEFPGTTRDVLEEQVSINDTRFRIFDTAGICSTTNPIEIEGIRRTKALMKEADFLLVVYDGSSSFDADDELVFTEIEPYLQSSDIIFIINKKDKPQKIQVEIIEKITHNSRIVKVSALENVGISELGLQLITRINARVSNPNGEYLVTNIRHKKSLSLALSAVRNARGVIEQGYSGEFIVSELHEAIENLGKIIGAITSEEVLNNIFASFCIGK